MRLLTAGVLVLVSALAVGLGVRPPEPDPIPQRWQLDIEVGPMRLAKVEVPERGVLPFFYMTYRVTNNSGEDLQFAPSFELGNEDGDLVRAGVDVPREVREHLLDLLDNPLLEDQIEIIGTLLQGRENAKDGLVIWPAVDLDADELNMYASGFSGETQIVPFTDPETGEQIELTFRKTYMVRYSTPGSLVGRGSRPLQVVAERWIMR
ncbi:MAG: hypothetical protein ACTS22_00255 [Phycisphaerales bacterium]